jgi:hypothetical protein
MYKVDATDRLRFQARRRASSRLVVANASRSRELHINSSVRFHPPDRSGVMKTSAILLTAAALTIGSVVAAPTASAATIDSAVTAARAYATARHAVSGVAVLDTTTGKLYSSNGTAYFDSMSIVKVFVAADLLLTGQMNAANAVTATRMIEISDNDAYSALAPKVGGLSVITRIKSHYNIPELGSPPPAGKTWGKTQISAIGMVKFYAAIKKDKKVGPWLMNAMHHHKTIAAGGDNQSFGIPSATTGSAVKQGWGDDSSRHELNSTGFVNSDRFTVAILTSSNSYTDSNFVTKQGAVATHMAQLVLPTGTVDLPEAPVGMVDIAAAVGSRVTIQGWTYDPDAKSSANRVAVYEGSKRLVYAITNLARPDVNKARSVTGLHGYSYHLTATNSAHTYCVVEYNLGTGSADKKICKPVAVNGSPRGGVNSIKYVAPSVVATGWMVDPDAPTASGSVGISVDGGVAVSHVTNILRTDVNTSLHVTGVHGFAVSLPVLLAGNHSVCATALNSGPVAPSVSLGCTIVAIPVAPPTATPGS